MTHFHSEDFSKISKLKEQLQIQDLSPRAHPSSRPRWRFWTERRRGSSVERARYQREKESKSRVHRRQHLP